MAFTMLVKDEILRQTQYADCCLEAFIAGILRINCSVAPTGESENEPVLRSVSENARLIRKIYSTVKSKYDMPAHIAGEKSRKLKVHNEYTVQLGTLSQAAPLLAKLKLGLGRDGTTLTPQPYFGAVHVKSCCRRAYLSGAFLAGGSLNEPERAYHCEISTHSNLLSGEISALMKAEGLNSRVILRKNSYVVYLKEAESISDFLRVLHAHNSLIEYENIRIVKDMRNNINRMVNCETANITKTVASSLRQVENIEYIRNNGGLEILPEALRSIAAARLENKEATLKELGTMIKPALSRSGINHRLNRIDEIAEELRQKNIKPR